MKAFISHSWNDKSLATQIKESLQKDGHEVWFDIHRLLPGDAIQEVIDPEIESSDVVVLVWTKNALASNGVNAEISTALRNGKRVIPLQADETALDQHPSLKGLLGIPFDDIPTGMLLLQRCLLMLMASAYKNTTWFAEAFDNVEDLGGYLYYVNTYRLKHGKNDDGAREQWTNRLEELRKKNEYIRQYVMTDAQDKRLMLQNIMHRLEQGNVPLQDLKQWQQWCNANQAFHPELMQKLNVFIENDIRRMDSAGLPVSSLDLPAAEKTVQRLRSDIEQKKEAAHQALVQQMKSFAGFLLGDKTIQTIVTGYLNYVTGCPDRLEELLNEAKISRFVAVKESVVQLLQYLDEQDHKAELQKNHLDGFIVDAYLIHNTAKLLLEANLVEKEKLSVDFVSENVVDKYVSFVLEVQIKKKLDQYLQAIRTFIGLKKNEINWGQIAAAAIGVAVVTAFLSEDGESGTVSRSATFEDQVGDFNARFGTSLNV